MIQLYAAVGLFVVLLVILLVICAVVGALGKKGDFVPPSRNYNEPKI